MTDATRLIAFLFLIIAISMLLKKSNITEGLFIWNIPTNTKKYTSTKFDRPTSTTIKHIYMSNQSPYNPYYNSSYNPYYNSSYNQGYNHFYRNSLDIDLDNHFRTYYPEYYYRNDPRYLELVY